MLAAARTCHTCCVLHHCPHKTGPQAAPAAQCAPATPATPATPARTCHACPVLDDGEDGVVADVLHGRDVADGPGKHVVEDSADAGAAGQSLG